MTKPIHLMIDDRRIEVLPGTSVIEAARTIGVEVPHFCYHPKLEVAGNCRMCLVAVEGQSKLAASCTLTAEDGMVVHTKTPRVRDARAGVLEFLLINHPLDCPICDQGGECDLQDLTMEYGRDQGRFFDEKRAVTDKPLGPLIKTVMNRCIHCMRCVRFAQDVAGVPELGSYGRGGQTEIVTYLDKAMTSELSGNTIDLCPVGALTSKPFAFKGRPWELHHTQSIDVMDAMGTPIRIDSHEGTVKRILPVSRDGVSEDDAWITDKIRFSYDGLHYQRIDSPYMSSKKGLSKVSWEVVLEQVSRKLMPKKDLRVGALAGAFSDVESLYMMTRVMDVLRTKKAITSYDCRRVDSSLSAKLPAHFMCNTPLSEIGDADVILIVGEGLRRIAPLLHAQILKAYTQNSTGQKNTHIYYIGAAMEKRWSLTMPFTHVSESLDVLTDIASGKHALSKKLKNAVRPLIYVMETVLLTQKNTDLQRVLHGLASSYCVTENERKAVDYNVVTSSMGQTGGLLMGFHSGYTHQIINEAESGKLDVLILNEFDDCEIRPRANCNVIYVGHHGDRGAEIADIVLPCKAFTEKQATYVTMFGQRVQTTAAVNAPEKAKETWTIWNHVLRYLGHEGFGSVEELHTQLKADHPYFVTAENPTWKGLPPVQTEGNLPASVASYQSYYLDNVIARNSRTMRACYHELEGITIPDEEGDSHA